MIDPDQAATCVTFGKQLPDWNLLSLLDFPVNPLYAFLHLCYNLFFLFATSIYITYNFPFHHRKFDIRAILQFLPIVHQSC